jgi:phage tail tape-measure protein
MSMMKSTLAGLRQRPRQLACRLGKYPVLVLGMASLAYRCGKDLRRMRNGEFESAEFTARAGSHVGGITGSFSGASAGAMMGSIVPGLGTILGGFAGGILGEYAGTKAGRSAVEYTQKKRSEKCQTPPA